MAVVLGLIAVAVLVTLSVLRAKRRAAAEASRRATDERRFAEARAEWRRRNCNLVVDQSRDGRRILRRDDDGKHILVDGAGREWRLYWGIGDPATGSFWDAFETRMMGMLSVPDWIGFHYEPDDIFLVHVFTELEMELLKRTDPWLRQRVHSVVDLDDMLRRASPADRRSGRDRRISPDAAETQ